MTIHAKNYAFFPFRNVRCQPGGRLRNSAHVQNILSYFAKPSVPKCHLCFHSALPQRRRIRIYVTEVRVPACAMVRVDSLRSELHSV